MMVGGLAVALTLHQMTSCRRLTPRVPYHLSPLMSLLWKVAAIVAYLKEVESPYEVLDSIRCYLGDTVEAKEFAKQFLERRAKQKANQQRQQQQVGPRLSG